MSILDNNNDRVVPQIPRGKMAANRLIQMTKQTYNQMVQSFNQGAKMFWQNGMGASPAEIASELGSDAKEVFELHYKLGQLIASVKPEAISEGASLIGNFTMNEDGTVTVVEQPTVPSEE
jgi:hypothetical protein